MLTRERSRRAHVHGAHILIFFFWKISWLKSSELRITPKVGIFFEKVTDYYQKWLQLLLVESIFGLSYLVNTMISNHLLYLVIHAKFECMKLCLNQIQELFEKKKLILWRGTIRRKYPLWSLIPFLRYWNLCVIFKLVFNH